MPQGFSKHRFVEMGNRHCCLRSVQDLRIHNYRAFFWATSKRDYAGTPSYVSFWHEAVMSGRQSLSALPRLSDVDLLGNGKRIVYLDP